MGSDGDWSHYVIGNGQSRDVAASDGQLRGHGRHFPVFVKKPHNEFENRVSYVLFLVRTYDFVSRFFSSLF